MCINHVQFWQVRGWRGSKLTSKNWILEGKNHRSRYVRYQKSKIIHISLYFYYYNYYNHFPQQVLQVLIFSLFVLQELIVDLLLLKGDSQNLRMLNTSCLKTTFGHFFANYMNIFHKAEVQAVILRYQTVINPNSNDMTQNANISLQFCKTKKI